MTRAHTGRCLPILVALASTGCVAAAPTPAEAPPTPAAGSPPISVPTTAPVADLEPALAALERVAAAIDHDRDPSGDVAAFEAARAAGAADPSVARWLRCAELRTAIGDAIAATDGDPVPWFRGAVADCHTALTLAPDDPAIRERRYQARHSWMFWLESRRRDDELVRLAAIDDCTALMAASDQPLVWRRRRGELYRRQALRVFFRSEDPREWFPRALADLDAWLAANPGDHAIRETVGATCLWFADATQRAAGDSTALLERAATELRDVVNATSSAWAWWQLGRVRQHQARNVRAAGGDPGPWCEAANGCLDAWAVIEPTDPDLYYTRAYVARIAEDYPAAIRHYERWLALVEGRRWRQRWVQGWIRAARSGPAGETPEWVRAWDLAWWHNDVGRYDRSRVEFERGFELAAAAGALDDPAYVELVSTARYDLACCLAVVSTGRPNALVAPTHAVPPDEAAALREAAMTHLLAAEAVTPSPADELADDADLAALRDDPRFIELLATRPRGGRRRW